MQPNSILAIVPSFTSYSSNQFAEIAAKVIREIAIEEEHPFDIPSFSTSDPSPSASVDAASDDDDDDDEGDFEFTFVCENPDAPPISADELFANGQIRPVFPIFNRDLVLEDDCVDGPSSSPSIRLPARKLLTDDRDPISAPSSSSSPPSQPQGFEPQIPSGKYSVWTARPTAAPERCKKSNSTGSSKLWRFRDLLNRSSSDGKEKFVFLSTSAAAIRRSHDKDKAKTYNDRDGVHEGKGKAQRRSSKSKGKSVSAHEMHYVTNRAMRESDRRRSYLPYRQDIVGFFANVNGLSKTLHPF